MEEQKELKSAVDTALIIEEGDYQSVINENERKEMRERRRQQKKFNWYQGAMSAGGIYFGGSLFLNYYR